MSLRDQRITGAAQLATEGPSINFRTGCAARQTRFGAYGEANKTKMNQGDPTKTYLEAGHGHLTAEDLQGTPMVDLQTGLFSTPFFFKRLGEEILRAERYRHFISVILIHAHPMLAGGTAGGSRDLRDIGKSLTGILSRRTDFQALFGRKQIAVLLPETDREGAASVLDRFHGQLGGSTIRLSYGTLSFPEDASNLKSLYRKLEHLSQSLIRGTGDEQVG